ncbi:hypothetical protein CASFOL_006123 [Castilleja foliolosa]|uniref:SnoaL-like domain-containing protein n=1 Tax=Castilleja foliolosa TaxID=1961234 RepID=A0ABD3E9D5_9LAMI
MAVAGFGCRIWRPPSHILAPSTRVYYQPISHTTRTNEIETPQLLKIAVSGMTELLRLFSPAATERTVLVDNEWNNEISASSANDVLSVIKSDYEKAYFVTGLFTSAIYAEDCTFEDPTIKFQGTELYARNLRLLTPFFDNPSIHLIKIETGIDSEKEFIVGSWRLRTFLKLPWKPLISIDGNTTYDLNEEFRIVRHVEGWNISALEAIVQIFTPSFGKLDQ